MIPKQPIDWKDRWYPMEDATYLNLAAHAAIPRVALNAVQASVEAKKQPHIVDDQSFFLCTCMTDQSQCSFWGVHEVA